CVMDSDGVLQEKMGSFPLLCDVLAYDLFMAHTIFTANDLPSDIEGREEQHTQYVPSILKEAFDGYRLKKAKKTMSPMHFIIVLLFLLISGGIALLVQMPSEPVTIVRPNSPLQQWQEHYSESLQVSDTLLNAQHLLVMSTLLPTGSSATTLSLRDKALILPIHNEPTVNPEEWRLWLNSNPSFTSVYDKTKQQVIVPIPPHHTLVPHYDRKRERILLQGLHELGIGIVLKEQRMPLKHGLITQYQLSGTLPLAALDIISELLHHPMVSLNEFSLSLNDDLTVTMTLGITLQGTIS
ncbi:hypothetical protein, partial [Aliivibrio fischeri]|uniref:hypothetical protein n=1 Tax=Aliivibrio fischeri TaxID=668 RepID=UPI0035558449